MTRTCYIIGNGPSHNDVPAEVWTSGMTFGMNYAGFFPEYYVCVDNEIISKHPDDIRSYIGNARLAFLSELLLGINSLYDFPNIKLVAKDTSAFKAEKFLSGMTAAYVALKCAYYLGYEEVHLYGVDHSPEWEHYRPDYRLGVKTTPARMEMMRWHFQLAQNIYTRAGRKIINHSNPSKLDMIFARAL
jgi:hypothetical protein